jgi:hypothetical protein
MSGGRVVHTYVSQGCVQFDQRPAAAPDRSRTRGEVLAGVAPPTEREDVMRRFHDRTVTVTDTGRGMAASHARGVSAPAANEKWQRE